MLTYEFFYKTPTMPTLFTSFSTTHKFIGHVKFGSYPKFIDHVKLGSYPKFVGCSSLLSPLSLIHTPP